MSKSVWIAAAALVTALLAAWLSPGCERKRTALGEVGGTLLEADRHQAAILEGGARVLKARHNLGVVTRATEYMSAFGSNTGVFRDIAGVAADADRECALLDTVLTLAARSTSESRIIVRLAELACAVEGTPQEEAWWAAYDEMAARAAYPSVEAALAAGQ